MGGKFNTIIGGESNGIGSNCNNCSIIQGVDNNIGAGSSNVHVIGDGVQVPAGTNNSFFVGCIDGIYCEGDVEAFSSSDERLKDNISLIDNCLEKVLSVDAINFEWNDKQKTYTGRDIGLIAQQVEVISPEIVETRKNGYKAIKYEKIVPILIGAIQDQQKIIDRMEDEIDRLSSP